VDLGREWPVQLLADGCLRLQGKAEFTKRRDRQSGIDHTVFMLSCRASFLFVTDKLLLPNELLSDELPPVG